MRTRRAMLALLGWALLGVPVGALAAQHMGGGAAGPAAARPFAQGEAAEYQVKLGGVTMGSGSMHLLAIEEVAGYPTYRARLRIAGGLPLARVDDTFESWIDVEGLFSRRFRQDQKELRFRRQRTYHFSPEERSYRRENGQTGTLPTARPLDEVSILYYARTLPLKVGETYTIAHYFKEDGNPVQLKVLRKETVRVPAGTFQTVVVQPIIQTKGLFGRGGRAEVYFTDDERRLLVQMKSSVPVVGSLSLHLRSYRAGSGQLAALSAP